MGKRLPYIALVLLVGVVAVVFLVEHTEHAQLARAAARAAARAGTWLVADTAPFNDPGIPWVMHLVHARYCASSRSFDAMVAARFAHFAADPVEKAYARLLDATNTVPVDYALLAAHTDTFDDVLIPALYCDQMPVPSATRARILAGEQASGYTLTHSYLALLFMQQHGCLTADERAAEGRMAEAIAREEAQAPFGDRYVERVAFLEYGGRADLVDPAWIKSIIAHQEADGGWRARSGSYLGTAENAHTTVLALWALTSYAPACPFSE